MQASQYQILVFFFKMNLYRTPTTLSHQAITPKIYWLKIIGFMQFKEVRYYFAQRVFSGFRVLFVVTLFWLVGDRRYNPQLFFPSDCAYSWHSLKLRCAENSLNVVRHSIFSAVYVLVPYCSKYYFPRKSWDRITSKSWNQNDSCSIAPRNQIKDL